MDNLFDLEHQNRHLSEKIVAGLERLSTLSRSLLWQEAHLQKVSPIQFQLLAFLQGHAHLRPTLTDLAREFSITKATTSDALKSLLQKGFITRVAAVSDKRIHSLNLTEEGQKVVAQSAGYLSPIVEAIGAQSAEELVTTWKVISGALFSLVQSKIVTQERMCFSCVHYSSNGREHYCALLKLILHDAQIRLDCPEHTSVKPEY